MTRLSVNINKVALLRNSRDNGLPNLARFALDCERFGANGITIHPRPDQRHIRFSDLAELKPLLQTELNVEGYPSDAFMQLVCEVLPKQVTLVPDAPGQLTSDHGWDTIKNQLFLREICESLTSKGIRVSLFVDANVEMVDAALDTGAQCVELYTEPYANQFSQGKSDMKPYVDAANMAYLLGLMVHAGHDLNLHNLPQFAKMVEPLHEVSIGHALVCDALYYGIENTIRLYQNCLHH
ncbi:MAG: pyridoxine 5'-phosphate synthase [Bacteroidetes bacterium]|nr:pyridoxine 5'-phosphate synthase [Bacteroidota bacterium]